ncbi:MAG: hypothetical protein ABH896_02715 [Candidatus Jacksonbacteria bacterium]
MCLEHKTTIHFQTSTNIIKQYEPPKSRLIRFVNHILQPTYCLNKSTTRGVENKTVNKRIGEEAKGVLAIQNWPPYWLSDIMHLENDEHLIRILENKFTLVRNLQIKPCAVNYVLK